MKYSHSGTRGGQTTTHQGQRTVSEKRTREMLTELYADRERYAERLDVALDENDQEETAKLTSWLNGVHRAIQQHEGNLREFEAKRSSVARTADRRIKALEKLMNSATREIDRAMYQQLITNERLALEAVA
jgi:hypothetical protein